MFLFQPSLYSTFIHDATYHYLTVVEEILTEGGNPQDGTLIFEKSKGRQFQGIAFLFLPPLHFSRAHAPTFF